MLSHENPPRAVPSAVDRCLVWAHPWTGLSVPVPMQPAFLKFLATAEALTLQGVPAGQGSERVTTSEAASQESLSSPSFMLLSAITGPG